MSRRFLQSLAKENILPSNLLSFPKHLMVPRWNNANKLVFRFYVTSNGNNNNDGLSWETAKADPNSVLSSLPEDGLQNEVWIIIEGGSYGPLTALSSMKNYTIKFQAASTVWINTGTGAQATWFRNGATNPVSNDNQIIFSGTAANRIISRGSTDSGLVVEFVTLNEDDNTRQFGRFVFKPGTHGNDPLLFLEGKAFSFQFCVFDLTGWNSTNPILWSNGNNIEILGGQIIGDPAYSHSNSTSAWRGVFALRHNDKDLANYWTATTGPGDTNLEPGFITPNGKKWDISEVANLFTDFYAGGENKHNSNAKISLGSEIYYSAPILGRSKLNIALTSGWQGTIEYDPSLTDIADGSTDPHLIKDVVSGNIKKLLSASTSENLNNFRITLLNSLPADSVIENNQLVMSIDEIGNTLQFKLKYSTGVVKTGSIALI